MASEKMKTRYDARAIGSDFDDGGKKWLWIPKCRKGHSPKLQTNWQVNDVYVCLPLKDMGGFRYQLFLALSDRRESRSLLVSGLLPITRGKNTTMSPIEPMRDDWRLTRYLRPVASKYKLLFRIEAMWNSLPRAYIQNLFESMPRRIVPRIGRTKY
ncbi:hypothetical protein TNCV_4036431 [Trichonephila clavipes]|nr:hypothetical protein TNCV_4036431 [Trichonephila clavipes]